MAMRSLEWYCRVAHDGDHGGEGKDVNGAQYVKAVESLRSGFGVLAKQRELLAALNTAMEALSEHHPMYQVGDDLRASIAAAIIRAVDRLWNLAAVVRTEDQ